MKILTWQNPEQLFVVQVLINKVKSKCCGIKDVKLYDSDFPEKDLRHTMRRTWVGKTNCFLIDYKAPALCEAYEAGKLKGKLREVASRLKEDDNGVFAIYKIK